MIYYIRGDPRFSPIGRSKREIINQWVKKEMKNLERLWKLNVPAPRPIKALQNLLVMEYIGDHSKAAPLLKDVKLENPKRICDEILAYIRKMYVDGEFIHSDLSEYNVLFYRNTPYLIDLAQGVVKDHPLSLDFLKRDIQNVTRFFRKYEILYDADEIFRELIS
jgi:RIO kinase 1